MLVPGALVARPLDSSVTTIVLPWTRVSYGTSESTFSTTRVRPFASATLTVSSAPCLTSIRRETMATEVSGRSSAMRAGLSTVNVNGCRRRVAQTQRQLHFVAGLNVDTHVLEAIGALRKYGLRTEGSEAQDEICESPQREPGLQASRWRQLEPRVRAGRNLTTTFLLSP